MTKEQLETELNELEAGLAALESTSILENDPEHQELLIETQKERIAEKQKELASVSE